LPHPARVAVLATRSGTPVGWSLRAIVGRPVVERGAWDPGMRSGGDLFGRAEERVVAVGEGARIAPAASGPMTHLTTRRPVPAARSPRVASTPGVDAAWRR
jgi:hypothetical protein